MNTGRRFFLSGVATALAAARALLSGAQRQEPPPQFPQIPDASGRRPGDDVPLPPRADPKVQLKEDQRTLRHDVDRLLEMVKQFKEEVDKTQETDVLSLTLVKKAEEIEKLARQMKELLRAA